MPAKALVVKTKFDEISLVLEVLAKCFQTFVLTINRACNRVMNTFYERLSCADRAKYGKFCQVEIIYKPVMFRKRPKLKYLQKM